MAEKVGVVELVQLPESMECSLCLATFKAPTLLRCGHTFCKVCLENYDKKRQGQEFMVCPLCKKRTKLGKNRVAGLALNFSVKGIKEDLKGNGKSPVFCSLHSEIYTDILCEDCNEFICLTCFLDKHQGHRFKKKEELEAYLKKKKKSLSKKCGETKVHINKSITNAEQYKTVMHSHLEELDREIKNSFGEKLEILQGHCERLSEEVNTIRNDSDKVLEEFIARQRQTLQSIDVQSGFMVQEGVASTSTCKFPDSDAVKTLNTGFLGLENELERAGLHDPSIARAKQNVENTQFRPADEYHLNLGYLELEETAHGSGFAPVITNSN